MLDFADLTTRLREFVAEGSGLDINRVFPGNDNSPTDPQEGESEVYASVLFRDEDSIGLPSVGRNNRGVKTYTTVETDYSVQWYMTGAGIHAHRFTAFLWSDQGKLSMDAKGFRIKHPIKLRRLDDMFQDSLEERVQCDLTVTWFNIHVQHMGEDEYMSKIDLHVSDSGEITIERPSDA